MRKIFLFMMVSVDGYFEGKDHDLSWHNVDAEFNLFASQQLNEVGTLLFGHRTYDMMASWWPTEQGQRDDPVVAKLMNEMPKVVVSHSSFTPTWNNTTLISKDVTDEIRKLKHNDGKDIAIFGSNTLSVSLLKEGIIDEIRIITSPVALGSGTPLFSGLSKRIKFSLQHSRVFTSGNVLNTYISEIQK